MIYTTLVNVYFKFYCEFLYASFLNMRLKCTITIFTKQNCCVFFLMQVNINLLK